MTNKKINNKGKWSQAHHNMDYLHSAMIDILLKCEVLDGES